MPHVWSYIRPTSDRHEKTLTALCNRAAKTLDKSYVWSTQKSASSASFGGFVEIQRHCFQLKFASRPVARALLKLMQPGDALVIARPSCCCRYAPEFWELKALLESRSIQLIVGGADVGSDPDDRDELRCHLRDTYHKEQIQYRKDKSSRYGKFGKIFYRVFTRKSPDGGRPDRVELLDKLQIVTFRYLLWCKHAGMTAGRAVDLLEQRLAKRAHRRPIHYTGVKNIRYLKKIEQSGKRSKPLKTYRYSQRHYYPIWTANRMRLASILYKAAITEWRIQAALLREDRKKTSKRGFA